jgi:hypothetical protein
MGEGERVREREKREGERENRTMMYVHIGSIVSDKFQLNL